MSKKWVSGLASIVLSTGMLVSGCAATGDDDGLSLAEPHRAGSGDGKADSSLEATFLTFDFDGELVSSSFWAGETEIREQLLYTIGHLNGDNSVGRLDNLELTNLQRSSEGGRYKLAYHAKLPVAWGRPAAVPEKYTLTLPRDVDAFAAFTAKYKDGCVDHTAHDVDEGSMWYYFRPAHCTLADADVVKSEANVRLSQNITRNKYPEYTKVWEDGELRVVAIFGKYEDGATESYDAGIAAYNEFIAAVRSALGANALVTVPAEVPDSPGVNAPDISFSATLPDGKKVVVNALLVDNVAQAGETFYDRYESLSAKADLIAYNGHAGLGQNVRALASRGKFVSGQYAIVFMNGCDTYAYVDGSLAEARSVLNPDDPTGTKYLDFVVNAMPAYFHQDSEASMALINALLSYAAPMSYDQIFARIDPTQVVLVTGEEDNVFTPQAGPPDSGFSFDELGSVTRNKSVRYTTARLEPGTYVVTMTGTHDADLYVRKGTDPSTSRYDCRPYEDGSNERCEIVVQTPTKLHVMVRGYAERSDFRVVGAKK